MHDKQTAICNVHADHSNTNTNLSTLGKLECVSDKQTFPYNPYNETSEANINISTFNKHDILHKDQTLLNDAHAENSNSSMRPMVLEPSQVAGAFLPCLCLEKCTCETGVRNDTKYVMASLSNQDRNDSDGGAKLVNNQLFQGKEISFVSVEVEENSLGKSNCTANNSISNINVKTESEDKKPVSLSHDPFVFTAPGLPADLLLAPTGTVKEEFTYAEVSVKEEDIQDTTL